MTELRLDHSEWISKLEVLLNSTAEAGQNYREFEEYFTQDLCVLVLSINNTANADLIRKTRLILEEKKKVFGAPYIIDLAISQLR